jgi:hypothetical protein
MRFFRDCPAPHFRVPHTFAASTRDVGFHCGSQRGTLYFLASQGTIAHPQLFECGHVLILEIPDRAGDATLFVHDHQVPTFLVLRRPVTPVGQELIGLDRPVAQIHSAAQPLEFIQKRGALM